MNTAEIENGSERRSWVCIMAFLLHLLVKEKWDGRGVSNVPG